MKVASGSQVHHHHHHHHHHHCHQCHHCHHCHYNVIITIITIIIIVIIVVVVVVVIIIIITTIIIDIVIIITIITTVVSSPLRGLAVAGGPLRARERSRFLAWAEADRPGVLYAAVHPLWSSSPNRLNPLKEVVALAESRGVERVHLVDTFNLERRMSWVQQHRLALPRLVVGGSSSPPEPWDVAVGETFKRRGREFRRLQQRPFDASLAPATYLARRDDGLVVLLKKDRSIDRVRVVEERQFIGPSDYSRFQVLAEATVSMVRP